MKIGSEWGEQELIAGVIERVSQRRCDDCAEVVSKFNGLKRLIR
jgi:hypothetical protein